jgi:beta-glucanase (GH16 family)
VNRVCLTVFACLLTHLVVFSQTPANDKNWQLKWADYFESFDTQRWNKVDYCDHGGKPSINRAHNVWVENGQLVIRVKSESATCPGTPPYPSSWCCGSCVPGKEYDYTSGWVETKSPNNDIKYGYIEAMIKFPYKKGIIHAFWTWRGEQTYNNGAEIDIFESMGKYNDATQFETNVHTCYVGEGEPPCEPARDRVYTFFNSDYTQWHLYAIEWNSNKITWYVDGKPIRSIVNDNLAPDGNGIIDYVRLILGINVSEYNLQYLNPPFEEKMYVDYVKVYSLKCACDTTAVVEIYNFNTYNYAVNKSISMSSATVIPSNSNICLRATDFIELKTGFEVPLGAEIYLDVNPCDISKKNVEESRNNCY